MTEATPLDHQGVTIDPGFEGLGPEGTCFAGFEPWYATKEPAKVIRVEAPAPPRSIHDAMADGAAGDVPFRDLDAGEAVGEPVPERTGQGRLDFVEGEANLPRTDRGTLAAG